jgi:hypothetical protein
MGILDKLRPQARWKHGDPMVRLEAVQALDDADEALVQVATEDSDARVRRRRGPLADADVLAAVTRKRQRHGRRDAAVQRRRAGS